MAALKPVRISEVFTSLEGEGVLLGTKTLFVRLAGCPFRCGYCDTDYALPMDSGTEYGMDEAFELVRGSIERGTFKVNFTGGDPLVQHEAVAELARRVRGEAGVPTYLESSCYDAARFRAVLPHMDYVKAELKTEDSGFVDGSRYPALLDEALECLRASVALGTFTYVKIVVGASTSARHLADLVGRAVEAAPGGDGLSGLVIQPVTGDGAPGLDHLLRLYDAARPLYGDVRVVPQLHKLIGAP